MNRLATTALLSAMLAAGASSGAAAQQGKCDINDGSPYQLNSAKIYLDKVRGGKLDEQPQHLRDAVRVLTDNGDKISNQIGRNYLLGQTYAQWMQQKAIPSISPMTPVVKRSTIGLTTDPDQTIDLVAAMDTAFEAVVAANPACAATVHPYRQNVYVPLVNASVTLLDSNKVDSAAALAREALLALPNGPHAYNVLASVAQRKNDVPTAIEMNKKLIAATENDTSFKKVREVAMYNLGVLVIGQAEAATGAERKARASEAAQMFRDYLKQSPDDGNAKSALARSLALAGDTSAVASIYSDMTQNPAKFSDVQLFEAGVGAARAGRQEEAAQLFNAGLAKNPYYRDALFNLATTYFTLKQYDKMLPVVQRLVAVDPSNPDDWRLMAGAYQGLSHEQTDAKLKKAQTDSLLKYIVKSDSLPVRVAFSAFGHQGATAMLDGSVENRSASTKTYTLDFDFLDATGNVIAKKSVTVGPVAPKATAPFQVQVVQSGIVAYRYAALQ